MDNYKRYKLPALRTKPTKLVFFTLSTCLRLISFLHCRLKTALNCNIVHLMHCIVSASAFKCIIKNDWEWLCYSLVFSSLLKHCKVLCLWHEKPNHATRISVHFSLGVSQHFFLLLLMILFLAVNNLFEDAAQSHKILR